MRSQKGVTLLGLVIYVTSFLLVTGIVAGITAFFYANSSLMSKQLFSAADYNKMNLYFVKESEIKGNRASEPEMNNNIYTLTFSNGDLFAYDRTNKMLYHNSTCICEDVEAFTAEPSYDTGKEVIKVRVQFSDVAYNCKYTMAQ